MSAGRICTRYVDLADPDETVQAAARRMLERKVGSLVILDGAKRPVGLVTDRDLVVRVLAVGKGPLETRVDEVMSKDLKTVSEAAPIEQALAVMRSGAFRRLPVVDRDGTLLGLVTLDDILSLLAEEFREIGTLVEQETPSGTESTQLRGSTSG